MTDDERIARRAAERVGAHNDENRFSEKLDGLQHPELFLPFELFDHLLNGLSTKALPHDNAHSLYDPKLKAMGYDVETFWQRLAIVAKPYLDARESQPKLHASAEFTTSTGKKLRAPVSRELCTARFAALQASRRALGGTELDRLLYVVVAPGISGGTSGNWSAADRSEQLRYIARGCP